MLYSHESKIEMLTLEIYKMKVELENLKTSKYKPDDAYQSSGYPLRREDEGCATSNDERKKEVVYLPVLPRPSPLGTVPLPTSREIGLAPSTTNIKAIDLNSSGSDIPSQSTEDSDSSSDDCEEVEYAEEGWRVALGEGSSSEKGTERTHFDLFRSLMANINAKKKNKRKKPKKVTANWQPSIPQEKVMRPLPTGAEDDDEDEEEQRRSGTGEAVQLRMPLTDQMLQRKLTTKRSAEPQPVRKNPYASASRKPGAAVRGESFKGGVTLTESVHSTENKEPKLSEPFKSSLSLPSCDGAEPDVPCTAQSATSLQDVLAAIHEDLAIEVSKEETAEESLAMSQIRLLTASAVCDTLASLPSPAPISFTPALLVYMAENIYDVLAEATSVSSGSGSGSDILGISRQEFGQMLSTLLELLLGTPIDTTNVRLLAHIVSTSLIARIGGDVLSGAEIDKVGSEGAPYRALYEGLQGSEDGFDWTGGEAPNSLRPPSDVPTLWPQQEDEVSTSSYSPSRLRSYLAGLAVEDDDGDADSDPDDGTGSDISGAGEEYDVRNSRLMLSWDDEEVEDEQVLEDDRRLVSSTKSDEHSQQPSTPPPPPPPPISNKTASFPVYMKDYASHQSDIDSEAGSCDNPFLTGIMSTDEPADAGGRRPISQHTTNATYEQPNSAQSQQPALRRWRSLEGVEAVDDDNSDAGSRRSQRSLVSPVRAPRRVVVRPVGNQTASRFSASSTPMRSGFINTAPARAKSSYPYNSR